MRKILFTVMFISTSSVLTACAGYFYDSGENYTRLTAGYGNPAYYSAERSDIDYRRPRKIILYERPQAIYHRNGHILPPPGYRPQPGGVIDQNSGFRRVRDRMNEKYYRQMLERREHQERLDRLKVIPLPPPDQRIYPPQIYAQ